MAIDLSDYVDVAERIREFHAKHPEGTLQSSYEYYLDVDQKPFLVVVRAEAHRDHADPRPGVGLAAENIPGKTPYTRDSELQNAETAAWGRAIIAVGAASAKRIASQEEVRNRQPVNNTMGLAMVGKMCKEKGWVTNEQKGVVAAAFASNFHSPIVQGINEDLSAFVTLVESGAVTLDMPADESTGE